MTYEEDIELAAARAADTEYLVRRSMSKGYQLLSVFTPPLYASIVIFRRGASQLTVNRLLRATWVGGVAGAIDTPHCRMPGIAGGGAFGYVRSVNSTSETLRARRIRAAYDTSSLRADDHATIGALLFAVVTPALFWKRATAIHLIFGGAGLGTAAGLFAHLGRSVSGDVPPKPLYEVPSPH
ncbi:hypothetical protein FA95DRAFT_1491245 [Auriscalpium vulgare]|uniref:Uncharacterized protein n=1 Tax=Auriscalpium vulgare TaxID=40419 RepID=A0ACB8RWB3_9AGAM|nr:hypothetical protein FA95DRAFT_1491245 [Auriscalpium vulgare]